MSRPKSFERILDLDVYGEVHLEPENGEGLVAAMKRLKVRTSKYRKLHNKSFVVEPHGGMARVTRIPLGSSKKHWRWIKLKLGETLVLSENPEPDEIKAAYHSVRHLNEKFQGYGYWETRRDSERRLLAIRTLGEDGTSLDDLARTRRKEEARLRPPRARYEELERKASLLEDSAKFNMSQSYGQTGGTANVWRRLAEKFQEEADALRNEAALLRAEENGDAA